MVSASKTRTHTPRTMIVDWAVLKEIVKNSTLFCRFTGVKESTIFQASRGNDLCSRSQ